MEKITAPFTPEQVVALNAFQTSMVMHPFTCGRRGDHEGDGDLIATEAGWVCPECDYTQDWAHAMMADPDLPASLVAEVYE